MRLPTSQGVAAPPLMNADYPKVVATVWRLKIPGRPAPSVGESTHAGSRRGLPRPPNRMSLSAEDVP